MVTSIMRAAVALNNNNVSVATWHQVDVVKNDDEGHSHNNNQPG